MVVPIELYSCITLLNSRMLCTIWWVYIIGWRLYSLDLRFQSILYLLISFVTHTAYHMSYRRYSKQPLPTDSRKSSGTFLGGQRRAFLNIVAVNRHLFGTCPMMPARQAVIAHTVKALWQNEQANWAGFIFYPTWRLYAAIGAEDRRSNWHLLPSLHWLPICTNILTITRSRNWFTCERPAIRGNRREREREQSCRDFHWSLYWLGAGLPLWMQVLRSDCLEWTQMCVGGVYYFVFGNRSDWRNMLFNKRTFSTPFASILLLIQAQLKVECLNVIINVVVVLYC